MLGSKLPSNKQMLCVFFYNHHTVKLTLSESARLTVKEASVFWEKAQIPTRKECHCISKLMSLYKDWQNLQKSAKREYDLQRRKENDLGDLSDMAHANAFEMMKKDVDKVFLLSQCKKGRQGSLLGINVNDV